MKVKKCKKCGEEIRSKTHVCLKCGKDQRFFVRRHPIAFIILILFILLAVFSGRDAEERDLLDTDLAKNSNVETKHYQEGEIFENGNLDVRFVSSLKDFKRYSQYANVKSQYKVLRAEFEFQNVSDVDRVADSNEFKCYADGEECERFYSVDNASFSITVSAGKKITKSVYFQIPVNSKEIKIQYETFFAEDGYVEFVVK